MESNICAHVLLNLLNSLRKSDEIVGFALYFIFFILLNKFNNTLMFDPLYIAHSESYMSSHVLLIKQIGEKR